MAHRFALLTFWSDSSRIHPDDLANLKEKICVGGLCCICFEELKHEGDYLTLSIENQIFRIKPDAIKEFPAPKFAKGQNVKVTNGTLLTGRICGIGWHHKRKQHIYLLEADARPRRKLKRQYYQEDLEAV